MCRLKRLNAIAKPDLGDCIDRFRVAIFVNELNLLKGYWQEPLTKHARELSAFVNPENFLQYKIMPLRVHYTSDTSDTSDRVTKGLFFSLFFRGFLLEPCHRGRCFDQLQSL